MDNGQELVAMCCMSYESPDEGEAIVDNEGEPDEAAGGYDYCEWELGTSHMCKHTQHWRRSC